MIDSDDEDKDEPEKGSDSEGDGGLDERAATRKIVASSSSDEEENERDSDVDTGVFDKRGRKRHDGGERKKQGKKGKGGGISIDDLNLATGLQYL